MRKNILRAGIATVLDALIAAFSLPLALYLRLGDGAFAYAQQYLPVAVLVFTAVFLLCRQVGRLQRSVWRFVSIPDMLRLLRVVVIAVLLFYVLLFLVQRLESVPRSVPLIHMLVLSAGLCTPRLLMRLYYDAKHSSMHVYHASADARSVPVLLAGVEGNAAQFLREQMQRGGQRGGLYRAVGIISEQPQYHGREILGARVYGDMLSVPDILQHMPQKPQRIIVGESYLEQALLTQLVDIAHAQGLGIARLPRVSDFQEGDATTLQPRAIAIEDILGRAQHVQDKQSIRAVVEHQVVMITGAGGSIGSELVRQLAAAKPARLILVELSEYQLYRIHHHLCEFFPEIPCEPVLGDIRDKAHMHALMARFSPSLLVHAAAVKHVPLSEENVEAAILTNVFGSKQLAELAVEHNVARAVLISTDKAVHPTNVMGASKRLAERVWQHASMQDGAVTECICVRFGNVLGSAGSVVPLFERQLQQGGPLTVTHPDMERYFMTIREAVELVLQAASLPVAHKQALYVLDMGTPIKIRDLAMQMIRLAGLEPERDIAIQYTGLRAGEKMYEELFYPEEAPQPTHTTAIRRATPMAYDAQSLVDVLPALKEACLALDSATSRSLLAQLVPEYCKSIG